MNTTPQVIAAATVTLHDLEQHFHLQFSEDHDFFSEWQADVPATSDEERHMLDEVKAAYMNLIKYPVMLENAVQITVVSPLLHLSSLLLPPFHLKTETSISVANPDREILIEGRIDLLVVERQFRVLIIESKRAELSIKVGLAQLLAYMLANPTHHHPCYGLITNGGSSLFVKLVFDGVPTYAVSRVFDVLNPGNDLYHVVSILKHFRQLALTACQLDQEAESKNRPYNLKIPAE